MDESQKTPPDKYAPTAPKKASPAKSMELMPYVILLGIAVVAGVYTYFDGAQWEKSVLKKPELSLREIQTPPSIPVIAEAEEDYVPSTAPMLEEEFDVTARGSKVQSRIPEIRVLFKEGDKLLLRLNMAHYPKARFDITFSKQPIDGWCAHIGDSPSNDGWRGDRMQFSNDAEVHMGGKSRNITVYGNDYTQSKDPNARLGGESDLINPGGTTTVTVGNGYVSWDNHAGKKGEIKSEYLFALEGQYDAERKGPNDKIIYASFNRVIAPSDREADGCVSRVKVTLAKK